MTYTQEDYDYFLTCEYESLEEGYDQTSSLSSAFLKSRGLLFAARYGNQSQNAPFVFEVPMGEYLITQRTWWTLVILPLEDGIPEEHWEDLSWKALMDRATCKSPGCCCVWTNTIDKDKYNIGIMGLSQDFVLALEKQKTLVALGPNMPPLDYYSNLRTLLSVPHAVPCKNTLNFDFAPQNLWHPAPITDQDDMTTIIEEALSTHDVVAIQGPPGTGKTTKITEFIVHLLRQGKSVLVTTLTNQTLMEVARKQALEKCLKEGKISKTSLLHEEYNELPTLQSLPNNECSPRPGFLTLGTFFWTSGWAHAHPHQPYDYVIVDEASQAFLPMLAASRTLGKKVIWIGDQQQLSPIVLSKETWRDFKDYTPLVQGFDTLCNHLDIPGFILTSTYRLTQRGAEYTGIFYGNKLVSAAAVQSTNGAVKENHPAGGPVFLPFSLNDGDKRCESACTMIFNLVSQLIQSDEKVSIAVLAKFKETVNNLQRKFNYFPQKFLKQIKVSTVEKVQGLSVDYTIFLIPHVAYRSSLDRSLFNVATSRASSCTFIVANEDILNQNMPPEVRTYLENLIHRRK